MRTQREKMTPPLRSAWRGSQSVPRPPAPSITVSSRTQAPSTSTPLRPRRQLRPMRPPAQSGRRPEAFGRPRDRRSNPSASRRARLGPARTSPPTSCDASGQPPTAPRRETVPIACQTVLDAAVGSVLDRFGQLNATSPSRTSAPDAVVRVAGSTGAYRAKHPAQGAELTFRLAWTGLAKDCHPHGRGTLPDAHAGPRRPVRCDLA